MYAVINAVVINRPSTCRDVVREIFCGCLGNPGVDYIDPWRIFMHF